MEQVNSSTTANSSPSNSTPSRSPGKEDAGKNAPTQQTDVKEQNAIEQQEQENEWVPPGNDSYPGVENSPRIQSPSNSPLKENSTRRWL